jgi:iron-sulfur cluster assembly accessory protein
MLFSAFLLCCQGCAPPEARNSQSLETPTTTLLTPKPNEPSPVVVTEKAAAMIQQTVTELATGSKMYLRVRVLPGSCQGFIHKLDLDADVDADDHVCESAGVSVVLTKRHLEMLRGSQVDYSEKDGQKGFSIENPNFKGEEAKKWIAVLQKEQANN